MKIAMLPRKIDIDEYRDFASYINQSRLDVVTRSCVRIFVTAATVYVYTVIIIIIYRFSSGDWNRRNLLLKRLPTFFLCIMYFPFFFSFGISHSDLCFKNQA